MRLSTAECPCPVAVIDPFTPVVPTKLTRTLADPEPQDYTTLGMRRPTSGIFLRSHAAAGSSPSRPITVNYSGLDGKVPLPESFSDEEVSLLDSHNYDLSKQLTGPPSRLAAPSYAPSEEKMPTKKAMTRP